MQRCRTFLGLGGPRLRSLSVLACLVVAVMAPIGSSRSAAGSATTSTPLSVYLPHITACDPVCVTEVIMGRSRANTVRILGEVVATSNRPVYMVQVEVRLYDARGLLRGTGQQAPVFPATLPGQPNPFALGINVPIDDVARMELVVNQWSFTGNGDFRAVSVLDARAPASSSTLVVEGELRNDYARTLNNIRVVAWSHHDGGEIVSTTAATSLGPGTRTPFSVNFFLVRYGIPPGASFKIVAQGLQGP